MGAWADLSLDATTLKGMVPKDFLDPDYGTHDTQRATADMVQAAKEYVETRLIAAVPSLIVKSPGPVAFMDAACGISNVANVLQQVLARSFLYTYYGSEQFSNFDVYAFKQTEQMRLFDQAFNAFVTYIQLDEDFLTALETTSDTGLKKYNNVVWC